MHLLAVDVRLTRNKEIWSGKISLLSALKFCFLRSLDFFPLTWTSNTCMVVRYCWKRSFFAIWFVSKRSEHVHCKMKRAKLTPKAKLAPMSWGPVWTLEVRFGLFKLKRVGQVPFRPLQNLNWPKWILLWTFFAIWPLQKPSRIYQFAPNEVHFLKWLIIIPKFSIILVRWKSHQDLNDTRT